MPKVISIYDTVQKAVAQALGETYMQQLGTLADLPSYKLADVGNAVFDAAGGVDVVTKTLVDAMGEFECEVRPYKGDLSSVMVKPLEWGGFIERAYLGLAEIIDDPRLNLVNGTSYDDHIYYAPNVQATIYQEGKGILTPYSITEDMLKTAFTGWAQMDKFLGGIRANATRTIEAGINSMKHMLVQTGIATSIAGTQTAVHLLTDAIAEGIVASGTTAQAALNNPDFLSWALMTIANVRDNMKVLSTAYNNGAVPTNAYSDDDTKLILLNRFEKACKFMLKSKVYNKDELSIGEYDRTAAWQGHDDGNKKFALQTVSSVKIAADAGNKLGIGTTAFEQAYVIGFAFDRLALGLCPFNRKVTSSYTAISDHWNTYHHLYCNALLDANYNMVAFVVD
jgi:hypothetical protein